MKLGKLKELKPNAVLEMFAAFSSDGMGAMGKRNMNIREQPERAFPVAIVFIRL